MYKVTAAVLVALLALSGCTTASSKETLTVFAASSLTEAFGTLEKRFERAHPEVDVQISYDGSSTLAEQLVQGASADVFASADSKIMSEVASKGLVEGAPKPFATNSLTIAVQQGNPLGITGLADLARGELTTVACQPQVPCGNAARELLARHGVTPSFDSEESEVKSVMSKVLIGEADAGLVYVTDVLADSDKVDGVTISGAKQVRNTYPIATLDDAGPLADDFQRYVIDQGQGALRSAGFGPPR